MHLANTQRYIRLANQSDLTDLDATDTARVWQNGYSVVHLPDAFSFGQFSKSEICCRFGKLPKLHASGKCTTLYPFGKSVRPD